MDDKVYDMIIAGAGPAGLTASVYASRYRMSNVVIGASFGGTINLAHLVENFPGFTSIRGFELGQKMVSQAKALGAELVGEIISKLEKTIGENGKPVFVATTNGGKEFSGRTLLLTLGTERRKLGIPGEAEYLGRGVSYCTNCDAPFFKDKVVTVIGGGDAAVSGAVHVAGFAQKVYLVHRRDNFRAEPVWIDEAMRNEKIEVIFGTNVVGILGYQDTRILGHKDTGILGYKDTKILGEDGEKIRNIVVSKYPNIEKSSDKVGAVELDKAYNGSKFLATDGVFIEVGGVPKTDIVKPLGVMFDESGFIVVSEAMETNVKGIFAAGDVTTRSRVMAQAVTACAQGAMAAYGAFRCCLGRTGNR